MLAVFTIATLFVLQLAVGLTHICRFPTQMEGEVVISNRDGNVKLHLDYKADFSLSRTYFLSHNRTEQSEVIHGVIDTGTEQLYQAWNDGSCTVTHTMGHWFPDCVPSGFTSAEVLGRQEIYTRRVGLNGEHEDAYIVTHLNRTAGICVPYLVKAHENPRDNNTYRIFRFFSAIPATFDDMSIFDFNATACNSSTTFTGH